jgi:hypothetical protein
MAAMERIVIMQWSPAPTDQPFAGGDWVEGVATLSNYDHRTGLAELQCFVAW